MISNKLQEKLIPIGVVILFISLIGITFVGFYIRSKKTIGRIIVHDVAQLATIFEKIHATCDIIDFEYQQNPINFLTIGTFVGSEVGPMNLAYPNKWEGPYLDDNPTIQQKEYMIIKTNNGYFVTPGNGVALPNGMIIGTDVHLDIQSDINQLVHDNILRYKNKALAQQIMAQ